MSCALSSRLLHERSLEGSQCLLYLIISIAALYLGTLTLPLLGHRRRGYIMASLDGFLLIALGGLVALHLLPEAIDHVGWPAALAAVIGLGLPMMLEKGLSRTTWKQRAPWMMAVLALIAAIIHTFIDGAGLALPFVEALKEGHGHDHGHEHGHDGSLLALGIVMHRLPLGLALGWVLVPRHGTRAALTAATILGVSTLAGFIVGQGGLPFFGSDSLDVFQALFAGTLLHVVFQHNPPAGSSPLRTRRLSALGALFGVGALVLLMQGHEHPTEGASSGELFLSLALESAPALLLAFVAAGLLRALLKPSTPAWLGRGKPLTQSLKGVVFGLPLPICSCSVVPLYESLVRWRVPPYAAMAFLVATPEIGLDAILLSLPLLGEEMAVARVIAAAIAALSVALIVGGFAKRKTVEEEEPDDLFGQQTPLRQRLLAGLRFGLGELLDHTMPWLLLGVFLAAMISPMLDAEALAALPDSLEIPLMALAGMPLYVCASGATPMVAIFLFKGLSPGAAIAFLLTGPATNITTFGILSRLHGKRAALAFGVAMTGVACALGALTNLLLPDFTPLDLQALSPEEASWLQIACLFVLSLLLLSSLWRMGPRGMLAQIIPSYAQEGDAHDHDHLHMNLDAFQNAHDHGHAHKHDTDHGHKHDHDVVHEHRHDADHDHEHGHDHKH